MYVYISALITSILLFSVTLAPLSFAHTTVHVESYEIEVGWVIEPPVVGFRNDFIIKIIEPGETAGSFVGVKDAFRFMDATAVFGGTSKELDINSDPRVGYYYSSVIPTKTGSYAIDLNGEIDGVAVDIRVPIEDVESTAILDFPPVAGSSSDQDVVALKNAVSSIQRDVDSIQSDLVTATAEGVAYDYAVFGLSIASAAIIVAIIALVKRK